MFQLIILLEICPFLMLSISFKWFLQFDDFANHNAFELLSKYDTSHLVFNDDIQVWRSIKG